MDKTRSIVTVLTVGIFVAGGLAAFYIHSQNTKFEIVSIGEKGLALKLDHQTGETWFIRGPEEIPIESQKTSSPEEEAIRLTRNSYALDGKSSTERAIRDVLQKKKGPLGIPGWRAKKVDEGHYLVSFTFDQGSGERGWFFDVHIKENIVRLIADDPELEKLHGIRDLREAEDFDEMSVTDLKNAAKAQEVYYVDHERYADTLEKLVGTTYGIFISSEGVSLSVVKADAQKYNMRASHPKGSKIYEIQGPGGSVKEWIDPRDVTWDSESSKPSGPRSKK